MLLRLPNPASRAAVLFAAFVLALALAFFSIRNALAYHASQLGTQAGYERAVRLEPSNALNWYLLGRYWQYSMEQIDPRQSIKDYRISLHLNPHSTDAWLDLATAYEGEGDAALALEAYLSAKRTYPLSAEVSWRYGNFLLRQGELDAAYTEIRRAVEVDPKRGAEAFSRCWRAAPDLDAILDNALPQSKDIYLEVIRELVANHQLDPALKAWSRLFALRPRMSPEKIASFTDALLQYGRFADLEQVWGQAVTLMDNPPQDPPGSIIWDGSFESGVIGYGLAWQFPAIQNGVQASVDDTQVHSGNQSLRLAFTGDDDIAYSSACHFAVAKPGATYHFSAWVRTEALTSDEGIRFQLDAMGAKGSTSVQTSDVHGSELWTNVSLSWTVPQESALVRVCVVRNISGSFQGEVHGTAWIDDVSLTPSLAHGPTP
jgi:tetratricopeptide (TPR) repeat protein